MQFILTSNIYNFEVSLLMQYSNKKEWIQKLLRNNTSKKYFKIVKYEKKSIYQKQIDNVINLNKKYFSNNKIYKL